MQGEHGTHLSALRSQTLTPGQQVIRGHWTSGAAVAAAVTAVFARRWKVVAGQTVSTCQPVRSAEP
jgi:hypothetical protein